MTRRVAVFNMPGLVVLGLSSAVAEAGYQVEPTEDPKSWANEHPYEAMLIGIRLDTDVELLSEVVTATPTITVVALLDPPTDVRLYTSIEAGASGCVSMDWSAGRILMAIEAGLAGLALLPASVARELAVRRLKRSRPRQLSNVQQVWLRRLAAGMTTQELALQVGFSERETYRRLREIYSAMGVRGRTEALMLASASGLLDVLPGGE